MDEAKRYEDRRDPAGLAFMTGAVDRLQARKQHHPAAEIARTQGRLAWHLSRYREAIAAFERSMTLARQAGDEVQAMKARRGIFTMLYELGDLRSARRVFEEAMRGSARVDDSSRARLEFDRGLLAEAEGQLELAQAAFAAVLRSPAVKPSSREAWLANVNRLTLALQRGDLDAARQVHGTIEELFARPEVNAVPGSRIARGLYAAQLFRRQGQQKRALELLAEVDKEKTLGGQWAWMVALEKGRVLADLGRQAEADASFEASAATVEKLRGDQFDELRPWVLERRRAPFVALFDRRVRAGDPAAALSVFERTQGPTFLEAFAAQSTADGASEATERFEWLRSLYPALKLSPVLGAPRTGKQLAAALGAVDAVAFFEADDTIEVIAYRGGRPRVFRAGRPLAEMKRLVADFVAKVGDAGTAEALGQALLPAGSLPRPGRTLYVIPSPLLARVPFAALRRNGRYLVEDHVLSEVPSLSALAAVGANRVRLDGPPAVLANARQNLPDAEAEGRWVATHLGAGSQLSLGGRQPARGCARPAAPGCCTWRFTPGWGPPGHGSSSRIAACPLRICSAGGWRPTWWCWPAAPPRRRPARVFGGRWCRRSSRAGAPA